MTKDKKVLQMVDELISKMCIHINTIKRKKMTDEGMDAQFVAICQAGVEHLRAAIALSRINTVSPQCVTPALEVLKYEMEQLLHALLKTEAGIEIAIRRGKKMSCDNKNGSCCTNRNKDIAKQMKEFQAQKQKEQLEKERRHKEWWVSLLNELHAAGKLW